MFRAKGSGETRHDEEEKIDFDKEAFALWKRLGLDPAKSSEDSTWRNMDAIWRHAGGGTVYVGNQMAAENLDLLVRNRITHVVNCTNGWGKIPNFHQQKLTYYEFDIARWSSVVSDEDSLARFTDPMFAFVENAVRNGNSVLVHCLAGAHRAGTTGVALLMHFAALDRPTAVTAAKRLRPIIDPIGHFPEFLRRLDALETQRRQKAAARK